ncbi:zinc-binding dehydrogenase [uncultured Mobiluncus sp.]|uniref:zinc-binding dehydrogenase n=1 Tax=uncultured Mobiluncus sp. TaxID=293425 RepID=UPI002635F078|nr:zinc-binding dehydrogenase [uncultured Mobiluncus sp.]
MWSVQGVDGVPVLVEVDRPQVGAGQILIEVSAAGVNRADLLQVAGHYPPPAGMPQTLGLEAAGTIVEVGPELDASQWLGRSVVALVEGGAQAEYCVANPDLCLPVPVVGRLDGYVAGAALLEAAVTAWHNLVNLEPRITWMDGPHDGFLAGRDPYGESWRYPVGFSVLIQGGSGGVGTVAVQLAKALGAHVAATAGDEARRQKVTLLGADGVADYRDEESLKKAFEDVTDCLGFDLILDVSGAGGLESNLNLLKTGGRLCVIGLQKGVRGEINLAYFLQKQATLQGSAIRALDTDTKVDLVHAVGEYVWPAVESGQIRPVIAETYPFAKVAQAHEALGAKTNRPFGKLILAK